jgi:hypothetical protein
VVSSVLLDFIESAIHWREEIEYEKITMKNMTPILGFSSLLTLSLASFSSHSSIFTTFPHITQENRKKLYQKYSLG